MDVTRRNRDVWIIDFGDRKSQLDAALHTSPFEHLRRHVGPEVKKAKDRRDHWWLHWRSRPEMGDALKRVGRFIATPRVSKHRVFVWLQAPAYPDCQLIVFARDDDYFFGVLHSRAHEVWARAQGTQVRERESGFRYTPTTCFETFPFPRPPPEQRAAVAATARELDELRNRWLNPCEWTREEVMEFPGSTAGPWRHYVLGGDERGVGVCATTGWSRVTKRRPGNSPSGP